MEQKEILDQVFNLKKFTCFLRLSTAFEKRFRQSHSARNEAERSPTTSSRWIRESRTRRSGPNTELQRPLKKKLVQMALDRLKEQSVGVEEAEK